MLNDIFERAETPRRAAPATPATGSHRLDIQGLRAVAVLAVVIYHAGLPLPGGFVGVDMFFVISGFVITAMILREWRKTGRFNLVRFYFKRFKRLTPALALMVTLVAILGFFLLSPLGSQQDAAKTGLGAMLLSANLVIGWITGDYFGASADTNVFLHTWSLAVEEQFYLIFPLLLFGFLLAGRRFFGKKVWFPVVGISAVAVVSLLVMLSGYAGYGLAGGILGKAIEFLLGFYSPLARSWEFAAGAVVALLGDRIVPKQKVAVAVVGWLGAALTVASLLVISVNSRFPGPITFLPVLGTMALLIAGSAQETVVSKVLATKPMVALGDWSYSIYLWHWPLIVLVQAYRPGLPGWVVPAVALFSIVPAVISYRYVESPLRSISVPGLRQAVVLILTLVSIPILTCLTLLQTANSGFWNPKVQEFQKQVFALPEAGCATMQPLSERVLEQCGWNPEGSGRQIYLMGDSNAAHFADGMVVAARDKGRQITILTGNGCPFLAGGITRADQSRSWNAGCVGYSKKSIDFLAAAQPGLVIVSNTDSYWDAPSLSIGQRVGTETSDAVEKTKLLREALSETVRVLREAGHEVLLIQTIPRWIEEDQWSIGRCSVAEVSGGTCSQSMPLSRAQDRQGDVQAFVREIAEREGAQVLETWPLLCPGDVCSSQAENFPRYKDSGHISVAQSKALAGEFARFF